MADLHDSHHHLYINIAGFVIALSTEDHQFLAKTKSRYADFLSEIISPDLQIEIDVVPGASFIEPKPGPWAIDVSYERDVLRYQSYFERGQVDLISGRGSLELAPQANIENFLRSTMAWLCLNNDSLLLHAAGCIREGEGYVFFGPSGAGKTTTSRIAAKSADIVSDDLVVIRVENGAVMLYGVPFRGELSEAPRANQRAPLKAIFRLRQSTDHLVQPIAPIKAVAELVASSPFVVMEPSLASMLVDVCANITANVPVLSLYFKRDDGFWRVIDEHFEYVS